MKDLLRERFPALACFHAQQSAEKALKARRFLAGRAEQD
ncbi:MAG: HEPN domain-containing protein [Actinomycetota bacterium]